MEKNEIKVLEPTETPILDEVVNNMDLVITEKHEPTENPILDEVEVVNNQTPPIQSW
jgi:hypothetical protein